MENTQIELGDLTFQISEPSINRGEAWRKRLSSPLDGIVNAITGLDTEIDSIEDVRSVIPQLKETLFSSVTTLTDLVCAWDTALEAEREYIFDNATASQVMEAFTVMVKMAFPFGGMVDGLMRLQNGLPKDTTSTSLVSQNGVAPVTSGATHN